MSLLRDIDLNLLVIFEAVYSAGNVTHASKQLDIPQPTLSNALVRLREVLDDPLFIRLKRGVEPTPKAVQLIGPVREALRMIEANVTEGPGFDPLTSKRHFRMVMLDQMEPILMPPIIEQVQGARSVTLEILPLLGAPVIDRLNDGSLDLVISPFIREAENVDCQAIGTADVVVVTRKRHPEISGNITLEQYRTLGHVALVPELQMIMRVNEELQQRRIERHVVYRATKFWSFPHVLANTDLIAMLPRSFAEKAAENYPLKIHPLPFDLPDQRIYMTWKKVKQNDPGHRWLREQIAQAAEGVVTRKRRRRKKPA